MKLVMPNPRVFWLFFAVSTMSQIAHAQQSTTPRGGAPYYAFRDAAKPAPKNPGTPVFHLSKDYPHAVPTSCPECAWLKLKVNFTPTFPINGAPSPKTPEWHGQGWDAYLKTIVDYVRRGQDDNLPDNVGFITKVDGKTRWYNVPWMAYDPTAGREYVHGTTNERTAHLTDIVDNSPHTDDLLRHLDNVPSHCKTDHPYGFESWSVGYYNEYGGQAIGRAIPSTGIPQMSTYQGSPIPAGLPFPVGTVVVKILTSSIPVECAPFLAGSPAWKIDRHKLTDKGYVCEREVQVSHVVQMDVAVVDPRSPTRWVYGTFIYDGTTPGTTFWDHMVPLGVQWGSDPWTFPAVPKEASLPLQQSVLNPAVHTYQHWGCMNRLAGPVDNPASSCTSCHMSAYAAPNGAVTAMGSNAPSSFGFSGLCQTFSDENTSYFQNQSAPQGYPGGRFPTAVTMDTSLQLAVAFTQFGNFNTNHRPDRCKDPNQIKPTLLETMPGKKVIEVNP